MVSAALAVIVACTASAGATIKRSSDDAPTCAWGASSVIATFENGEVVESTPQTSGCTSGP
jgi:hypothetical protein